MMKKNNFYFFALLAWGVTLNACTLKPGQEISSAAARDKNFGLPQSSQTKLYLLVGQSNMAGRGRVGPIDKTSHPQVYSLAKDGHWVSAMEPIHFDKPKRVGVSPGLAFGKVIAADDPQSIIGLIPSAVGGSVIASWRRRGYHSQTKVYPYDDAIRRAKIAIAKGGKLEAILWHQGEHDSRRDKAGAYESELTRLVSDFRRDLNAPNVPFIVGGLGDFLIKRNSDTDLVQLALSTVSQRVTCTAFVSASGLVDKGDELHFDAASAREFGRRYARKLMKIRKQKNCRNDR